MSTNVPRRQSSKSADATVLQKSSSFVDSSFFWGTSKFNYPNGDKYDGGYCAHISGVIWKEGLGTYQTRDGQSYKGKWYNDKLMDGDTVVITYPDGTVYEGLLDKYKYKGAGCIVLPTGLKFVMEFVENKPVGSIVLSDNVGRSWYGKAETDHAILLQENIFLQNIPLTRGRSRPRYKAIETSTTTTGSPEKLNIDMVELEKRVFDKGEKLEQNYNFEDSEWYQSYLRFKKKQKSISDKVKQGLRDELTPNEIEWCLKYEEFRDKYLKWLERRKIKPEDPIDMSLIETFYSEQYMSSKPEFVMYPTKKEED